MITLSDIEVFAVVCARNDGRLLAISVTDDDRVTFVFTTGELWGKARKALVICGVVFSVISLGFIIPAIHTITPIFDVFGWLATVLMWMCIGCHYYLTKYQQPKTADEIREEWVRELRAYHEGDVGVHCEDGVVFIARKS